MSTIPSWLPIAITLLALAVATLSLGWNIYRDVALRARVIVSFSVKWTSTGVGNQFLEKLVVSAVNYGPGNLRFAALIEIKNAPLWRRALRKVQPFVVTPEWNSPYGTTLPATIDVSEQVTVVFPYDEGCFLGEPVTHVGIRDSFGRIHWAPRSDVKRAIDQFRKDFRKKADGWRRIQAPPAA